MKRALLVIVSLVALRLPASGDDLRWQKANSEFAAGDFKAAIAEYEAEIASGEWSANLFYNLANAYFRTGQLGRAVLNYERALQLDAKHPEAEANLQIAREQARALEWRPAIWDRYFDSNALALAAATLFWLGVVVLTIRPGGLFLGAAVLALIACAACIFVSYAQENGIHGSNAAVITRSDVEARVATADTARSVLALTPGSQVLILQQRGDWDYAQLPSGERGWIPAGSAERIRL